MLFEKKLRLLKKTQIVQPKRWTEDQIAFTAQQTAVETDIANVPDSTAKCGGSSRISLISERATAH
jgi:hypothetical protein